MLDPKILDDIARQIGKAVPDSLKSVKEDLDHNIRAALTSAFTRLDLVTREEFEVQSAVLARTRARLEALEARVQKLEALLEIAEAEVETGPDETTETATADDTPASDTPKDAPAPGH